MNIPERVAEHIRHVQENPGAAVDSICLDTGSPQAAIVQAMVGALKADMDPGSTYLAGILAGIAFMQTQAAQEGGILLVFQATEEPNPSIRHRHRPRRPRGGKR